MIKLSQLVMCGIILGVSLVIIGCKPDLNGQYLKFATSAEYPPFEYKINGELHGFDIELAKRIAKELGKEAHFEDMQFSTILPALQNGYVDAAIATLTVTYDRKKHFDFSNIYYFDSIAAIYKDHHGIKGKTDLSGKKIACQLGSTMEIWLKNNGFANRTISMDNNNLAIEALKAGHVDVVLMDGAQGHIFSQKNKHLAYQIIEQSENGYAIATPKNSLLLKEINQAIEKLSKEGEIAKLEEKWLKGDLPDVVR